MITPTSIQREYIGGRALPVCMVKTAVSPLLRGNGLTPFGGSCGSGVRGEIPSPSGAGLIPFGGGLVPFGGAVMGDGKVEDFFNKLGRDTKRAFTSKKFKGAVKFLRGIATPILKTVIPTLIDEGAKLATSAHPVAGVLAGVLKDPAKKGLTSLVDLGNAEASKAGYGASRGFKEGGAFPLENKGGAQFQGFNYSKPQIDLLGSKDVELDRHSIDILDSILGKRGGGLRRV